ncbi:MAG TPA: sulfatase-like hydrolase/transferase [Thermoplasmata archaeon]
MPKRNLIVIVADTLRDPRPLQNGGPPLMPFLDRFGRDGLRLDRLMASSSWTAPSHVSLLTGTDPWETHFELPGAPKRPKPAESLADRWTKEGGVSAAFSANFVVTPVLGTATGYTRFNPGFPSTQAGQVQLAMQFLGYEKMLYWAVGAGSRKASRPLPRLGAAGLTWLGTGACRAIGHMRSGPTLVKSLGRFLHRRPSHGAKPLHVFVNLVESHEPYLIGDNGGPVGTRRTLAHLPSINLARLTDALTPESEPKGFVEAYRESLPKLDSVLEQLVATLKRNGALDDAVLMFLSDHGQSLGEHGFYGHGYRLYDELVKIPGYIWEFKDGRVVPIPSAPADWVDHRHIFDLLSTATPDGGPLDAGEALSGSLLRRGPAASYFEGPAPRPPGGFVFRAPQTSVYRLLRIQQAEGAAMVSSDVQGGRLQDVPMDSPDVVLPELGDLARQILSQIKVAAASTAPGQAELDAKVDARLKSWGYD